MICNMKLIIIMGSNESKKQQAVNTIDNIYAMFQQSNSVVLHALQSSSPALTLSRIKNIENVVEQLLDPFKQNSKYVWGGQIYYKFKKHFTQDFQALWAAGRQQFYQILLINCKINSKDLKIKQAELGTYQECFYRIAAEQLEMQMADTFIGEHQNFVKKNLQTLSVIGEQIEFNHQLDSRNPGTIPFQIEEEKQQQSNDEVAQQYEKQNHVKVKQIESLRLRKVENCSLVLPQTLFPNRLSVSSQQEVYDLLKFYKQFSISLQQIFYSNNLISCPIKNFIFCLEEKISRKKIKPSKSLQEQQIVFNDEYRKISRIRQSNTNHLLYQVRSFLNSYTEFVWMFLQLHLMEEYTLSKIIQAEILYGIIFKNIWTFIDWIAERGFEYQEAQLENKMKKQDENILLKIPSRKMDFYISLIEELRGQKHPQQYLKKVVVFYRQVSKQCQNADELLSIYEQVMRQAIKRKGSRNLALFRMKNVIQKLLNIQNSSFSGGEITYSWTTWCILIQLLKQKVSYKYDNLVISKKMSEEIDLKSSEIVLNNSNKQVTKIKKMQKNQMNHISKS